MLYEHVFQTPRGDNIIAPDPDHYRRGQLGDQAACTTNNGLALLLSCQQAHEEAVPVLYIKRVFYFDDNKRMWLGFKIAKLEASDHCSYCLGRRIDPHSPSCYDASGGKHDIFIQYSDIASMHDWLSNIGERNRLLIQPIQLSFSGSQYTEVLGVYNPGGKPRKPSPVGGDLLEKALKLLASGHNLDTIKISLEMSTEDFSGYQTSARLQVLSEGFMQLFAIGSEDRLKNAFSGVQGIRQLDSAELEKFHVLGESTGEEVDMVEDAHSGLGQVKSLMESGYATRQKLGVPYPRSADVYIGQGEHSMREPRNVAEWLVTAPALAKEILNHSGVVPSFCITLHSYSTSPLGKERGSPDLGHVSSLVINRQRFQLEPFLSLL